MYRQRLLTLLFALACCCSYCAPLRGESPLRDHDIEAEDYFGLGVMANCQASPDGSYVVYTESRWAPPAEKRNVDLWIVETAAKKVRRLTFDPASDSASHWSPDGRFIYFTSNRKRGEEDAPPYDGTKQIWRISPSGGSPFAVTKVKDGVQQFDLAGDGRSLYYTVGNEVVDEEWKSLRKEYKDLQYGHGVTKFSQVWRLDLATWRSKKIVDDKRVVVDFEVSNDERRIAMVTRPDETLLSNEGWTRIDVWEKATDKVTTVTPDGWRASHPSPYGWIDALTLSADGDAVAFSLSFDGFPTQLYVVTWQADEPTLRALDRTIDAEINGGSLRWKGNSRDLCMVGQVKARSHVFCIGDVQSSKQGKMRAHTEGDLVVSAYSHAAESRSLFSVLSTTKHPPDLFRFVKPADLIRLTKINPQVDSWKLPQISIVSWKGAHGDTVEGILELPHDHKPGTPLPMVVEIHGGPTSASMYQLRFWIYGRTLLASKGYALLSPNYRGSTGYGDEFMVELVGHENEIEVEDILKGVDAMVERGIADKDRLGVMGWSNGGYLTNCLITHTTRFKAASSGAGVLDMVIQWGTEDTPGHVINYMEQSLPWDKPEHYEEASPLYSLDKVVTPTVIHVGGEDPRVPVAHSRALYRGLKHYLNVPAELVIYPGEGHGLTKYENRKAKMAWDLAWFDRYLLGKSSEDKQEKTETVTN